MQYHFNINLTEKDYYKFNEFVFTKSYYGKKNFIYFRIFLIVIMALVTIVSVFQDGFNEGSFFAMITCFIVILLFQLVLIPFFKLFIKIQLKIIKVSGKMGFSPSSVMEFKENYFIEMTSENETKCMYSGVERVSIIEGQMIYIHANHSLAYLLPYSVFENHTQFEQFIDFLKDKCCYIDFYKVK